MTTIAAVPTHGVGSRQDLPLPFDLLLIGAVLALVVSFVALGVLWREPRIQPSGGRPVPRPVAQFLDSPLPRRVVAALGLLVAGWTLLALVAGRDNANNPAIYVIYVWLWVGLAFLSILVGPAWRLANPMRTLHRWGLRALRLPADFSLRPYRLGYWPAAAGLFAFTWLELIAPDRATTPVLRIAVLEFIGVTIVLSLVFGRKYFDKGDPFEAYARLYGSLSMLGRRSDGRWSWRSPLHGPNAIEPERGLLAVTAVMLGGTAYDSFSAETAWYTFVQSSALPTEVLETGGLLIACGVIAGSLALAALVSARLTGRPVRGMATALAPSLVPIAAGYVVAHYWSLFVFEGVHGLQHASDPLGIGANWLGTAGIEPSYALIEPGLVATIQVCSILTGHVLGVVLAHERALLLFERRAAVVGQIPLLVLMVFYTVGGLSLLFTA